MNHTLKRLTLMGVALLGLASTSLTATAQQYTYITLLSGGTNNVLQAATNSYTSKTITLTKFDQVVVDASAACLTNGTPTGTVELDFQSSADGTQWDTNNVQTLNWSATGGTTSAYACTNFTVNSMGYLRLSHIRNSSTNVVTNITVRAWTKPRRNG